MNLCMELKKQLFEYAVSLPEHGLATGSTGNISAKDPETGYIVIKSSGIPYAKMTPEDFTVLDSDGKVLWVKPGEKPSFETPTHLAVYRISIQEQIAEETQPRTAILRFLADCRHNKSGTEQIEQ